MDDDVEPERYYEWILWKLRKEKDMKFYQRISLIQENSELMQEIKILKEEIAVMNKEKYGLLNRIKELNDIRDSVVR